MQIRNVKWLWLPVAAMVSGGILGAKVHPSASRRISVVDDIGGRVTLPRPATRIVVIEPSNAEIALDLGLQHDIVGADASVFQYTPRPWRKALRGLHDIGPAYPAVSAEAIVARRPNLVISGTGVDGLSSLKKFHIPVLYLDPSNIRGVYHDISLVGKVTARRVAAARLVAGLKRQMRAIRAQVAAKAKSRPTVFFDLGGLYSAGPKSFINSLIQMAGATNVVDRFSHRSYPKVTAEQVVRANPDIIVVDPEGTSIAKEKALAGFSAINAVKHHCVYALPHPSYVDQPSPGLVNGLKEFVHLFHPKLHLG